MMILLFLLVANTWGFPAQDVQDTEKAMSRKLLGSSVVTSVSVIMDGGAETHFTDAVGKPVAKPQSGAQVASPINLLNPDRYEFYTFDDSGDLVKRLMTLEEIQSIIANGDGEAFSYNSQAPNSPEKKVDDVVNNVQNVLKEEIKSHKNNSNATPVLDTPDVSSSWSMILPAIFGNSGEQIKPSKPQASITPETIMVEESGVSPTPVVQRPMPFTPNKPNDAPETTTEIKHTTSQKIPSKLPISSTTENLHAPLITVAIITHSKNEEQQTTDTIPVVSITPPTKKPQTTKKPIPYKPVVNKVDEKKPTGIKPILNNIEATKDNTLPPKKPLIKPSTYRPSTYRPSTYKIPIILTTIESTVKPVTTTITTLKPKVTTTKVPATTTTKRVLTTATTRATTKTPTSKISTTTTTTTKKTTQDVTAATSIISTTLSPPMFFTKLDTKRPLTQFIQLFDPSSTTPIQQKYTDNQLFKETERPLEQLTPISYTSSPSDLSTAVFVIDHKTNTRIPITTKEQLATLLSSLPHESTTELLKSSPTNNLVQSSIDDIFTASQEYVATTTNLKETHTERIQPTTTTSSITITKQETMATQPMVMLPDLLYTQEPSGKPEETKKPDSSDLDRLSVPEILDQLLLTSTNIYEINTELSDKATTELQQQTTENLIPESTQKQGDSTTLQSDFQTTIYNEQYTTNNQKLAETTNIPSEITVNADATQTTDVAEKTTTEEANLINSIEQLIQQAVGNIAEVIADDRDKEIIGDIVESMSEKPMSVLQMESATSASILLDHASKLEEDAEPQGDSLSDAMDSLLSQVVDSDKQGLTLTTLQEFSTTPEQQQSTGIEQRTTEVLIETTEALKTPTLGDSTTEAKIETTTDRVTETATDKFEEATVSKNMQDGLTEEVFTERIEGSNEILNTEASSYLQNDHEVQTMDLTEGTSTKEATETTTVTNYDSTQESTRFDSEKTTDNTESTVIVEATTEVMKTTQAANEQKKTTIIAIISKPSTIRVKNTHSVSPTSQLKPDVKKDDSLVDSNNWSLVSTIAPHSNSTPPSDGRKPQVDIQPPTPVKLITEVQQGHGLEDTTAHLDPDIYQFVALCNELAFGFWNSVNNGMSAARSVFVSPFAATSLLAMVFLGARGATSGEMNEILRLDDMVTFNPHLILRNITESIVMDKKSGVATSVILRELYSDKSKGHLLNFYKERARQFYDGHVEEVSFKEVGDIIRRRTNLIVKRQTWGKIQEYIKDSSITVKPPLAGVSISIFQTDCSVASTEGRDGELYFVVLPSIRQRRLIPVPAAVWRSDFLAGYEPGLDATAVSLGGKDQVISTIFVIPGQQGISAPGDGLARLERHLISSAFKDGAWARLLKSLIPRPGLEVQIPRFSHKSVINASVALQHMGMKDLFDSQKADLRGLNGVANDLYLSDILQVNSFATCGEDGVGEGHHSEIYPATANRTYRRSKKFKDVLQPDDAYYDSELLEEPRDYQRAFHDPLHDPTLFSLPLPLRPRQARLPDVPRLRFDRPFLYFVRHNPTGLVLHMGRFNPRLLP